MFRQNHDICDDDIRIDNSEREIRAAAKKEQKALEHQCVSMSKSISDLKLNPYPFRDRYNELIEKISSLYIEKIEHRTELESMLSELITQAELLEPEPNQLYRIETLYDSFSETDFNKSIQELYYPAPEKLNPSQETQNNYCNDIFYAVIKTKHFIQSTLQTETTLIHFHKILDYICKSRFLIAKSTQTQYFELFGMKRSINESKLISPIFRTNFSQENLYARYFN